MSGIVVDASITLSWFFPDEQTVLSIEILDRIIAGEPLVVPAFWYAEVLNVVLNGERRGRVDSEETQAFLSRLRSLKPTVHHAARERVWGLVQTISREHRITPYDALYIELALRRRCPLATLDQRQREAAVALGVECL